jgi:hypothetical protein
MLNLIKEKKKRTAQPTGYAYSAVQKSLVSTGLEGIDG